MASDNRRFPIGRYESPDLISPAQITIWIDDIAGLPADLRRVALSMTADQLETPYRPGGWNSRQVIHHLADSHVNAFIRFKWALTENQPTIKPYFEERWAELPDYNAAPIETSLDLLDALHSRWVVLLRSLTEVDLQSAFDHPEIGTVRLDWNIGQYAWHGRHHLAHVESVGKPF